MNELRRRMENTRLRDEEDSEVGESEIVLTQKIETRAPLTTWPTDGRIWLTVKIIPNRESKVMIGGRQKPSRVVYMWVKPVAGESMYIQQMSVRRGRYWVNTIKNQQEMCLNWPPGSVQGPDAQEFPAWIFQTTCALRHAISVKVSLNENGKSWRVWSLRPGHLKRDPDERLIVSD